MFLLTCYYMDKVIFSRLILFILFWNEETLSIHSFDTLCSRLTMVYMVYKGDILSVSAVHLKLASGALNWYSKCSHIL